jgi:hypothetical protein
VDKVWVYEWPESSLTPEWGPLEEFHTIQQVELVPKLFEVSEHRARLFHYRATVLKEFVGETFGGIIGCDYHSAYRRFLRDMGTAMQFCWAYLIRDVKFSTTLTDRVTRKLGDRLLASIKRPFRTWHAAVRCHRPDGNVPPNERNVM